MPEVQRLVGVRRRELYHYGFAGGRQLTVILSCIDFLKGFPPESTGKADIQKALYHIEGSYFRTVVCEPVTDGLAGSFRREVRNPQKREYHKGIVTFKFFAGRGNLKGGCAHFGPEKGGYGL